MCKYISGSLDAYRYMLLIQITELHPGTQFPSTHRLAFLTSIYIFFMIYFFSPNTISSFLKCSLLYCYHFMFEILNAKYVVQYIYILGEELNNL